MEISRLDAWYSSSDGSLEGPATYIVRGLCRRCCIPEVALRCMQVGIGIFFRILQKRITRSSTRVPIPIHTSWYLSYLLYFFQVSVSLMESGNPPESHDDLIELVSSPETGFLCLFSQKQMQVRGIPASFFCFFFLSN